MSDNVINSPRSPKRRAARAKPPSGVTIPFTEAEWRVITAHLRERDAEISEPIGDAPISAEVVRFMSYVWEEQEGKPRPRTRSRRNDPST
jgi:hypothetical protein